MIMSLRGVKRRSNPLLQGDCFGRESAALAMTYIFLCDALEARLQSADAARERGRLVAAVMAGVGG